MSLQPEKLPVIPEETARVARILFPKGNRYMWPIGAELTKKYVVPYNYA
jgi:hypothetical protein